MKRENANSALAATGSRGWRADELMWEWNGHVEPTCRYTPRRTPAHIERTIITAWDHHYECRTPVGTPPITVLHLSN